MIVNLPIYFDNAVQITYLDGRIERSTVFPTNTGLLQCSFSKMNGYDASRRRVTNLVGYDGQYLLKLCPNCQIVKTVTEFGYSGRITNIHRDQSHCSDCRAAY